MCAISWYGKRLTFLRHLALSWIHIHKLRSGRLFNCRLYQFFILRLIYATNCCSCCVGLCSCSTALVIQGNTWLLFLAFQQLLHELIILVNRERLVLTMGTLHRLLVTLPLNEALWVIILVTCFEWSWFSRFSRSRLAVCWGVWLTLCDLRLCHYLLHLIDRGVLLSRILSGEVRSLHSLMVRQRFFIRILCLGWIWSVYIILRHANVTAIDYDIKHWVWLQLSLRWLVVLGILKLLLLHLLLLELLLKNHLLLLVLAESIELIMLHSLLLLQWHRMLFIWICEEIILFDIWLIQFLRIAIK